ncbi:hypothetical protein V501_07725 [Pseudogymnoascus sp. VKM F-4519 (FW-2642)]|nr:hypothetical protein V501_07725 [Pseudogymnoascus sp. VKM F-4519 (FW-2642)]
MGTPKATLHTQTTNSPRGGNAESTESTGIITDILMEPGLQANMSVNASAAQPRYEVLVVQVILFDLWKIGSPHYHDARSCVLMKVATSVVRGGVGSDRKEWEKNVKSKGQTSRGRSEGQKEQMAKDGRNAGWKERTGGDRKNAKGTEGRNE